MIKEAEFVISLSESIRLLTEFNLFKGRGYKNAGQHSSELKKIAKRNKHTEIYDVAIANKDYEILLIDESIFQFCRTDNELRFAFIQNPNVFPTRYEYLASIYEREELIKLTEEEITELISSINEEEYEQYLDEQELNLEANIIRYDLSPNGYLPLIHSYSHIHIGLNPSFRLPCSKILNPLQFVLFTVKHTYYQCWKNSIKYADKFIEKLSQSKKSCLDLSKLHWQDVETNELFII